MIFFIFVALPAGWAIRKIYRSYMKEQKEEITKIVDQQNLLKEMSDDIKEIRTTMDKNHKEINDELMSHKEYIFKHMMMSDKPVEEWAKKGMFQLSLEDLEEFKRERMKQREG